MPHQCTECGKAFEDGSTEMLSGCPSCGGNKFQYLPEGRDGDAEPAAATEEAPEPPDPPVESTVARTVGNAATAVRDFVGSDSPAAGPPSDGAAPGAGDDEMSPSGDAPTPSADEPSVSPGATEPSDASVETEAAAVGENSAQASARSEVVSRDDLPPAPENAITAAPAREPPVESEPTVEESPATDDEPETDDGDDRPGLDELREELNDQFESIKVIEPGQYELNLMELYDREEYIIALQEDGKYTIQVPEHWED